MWKARQAQAILGRSHMAGGKHTDTRIKGRFRQDLWEIWVWVWGWCGDLCEAGGIIQFVPSPPSLQSIRLSEKFRSQ
jgi:hypothetical protein